MIKFICIFFFFLAVKTCHAQDSLIRIFGIDSSAYSLTLKPEGEFIISVSDVIGENMIGSYDFLKGIWKIENNTIILQDTTHPAGNINRHPSYLKILDEYNLLNLNLSCFSINDTISIIGLKDSKYRWSFYGKIINGKMTGSKIDISKNKIYKLKNGKIIKESEIE